MAFRVLQPCHRTWSSLEGEGSTRHCRECERKVYDLDQFSDRAIRGLLASGQRICGKARTAPRRTFLASLTAFSLSAFQSSNSRELTVRVTDASGGTLPTAAVELLINGQSVEKKVATNDGEVLLRLEAQTDLSVKVTCPCFVEQIIPVTASTPRLLQVQLALSSGPQCVIIGVIVEDKPPTFFQRMARLFRWLAR
jgi:hypothetical protein